MTKKVDYKSMKDLTGKEILAQSGNGDIELPELAEEEKKEFFQFVKTDPGSKERIDFINERKDPDDDSLEPPAPTEEPGEKPPASKEESQEDKETIGDTEPPATEEPGDEPPASEEPEISNAELMTQLAKKDDELRKQRNSASDAGRKRKEAEDQVKELELKIKEQADALTPAEVEKPTKPKRPKVRDFDGDAYSQEYIDAVEQYDDKIDVYDQQLEVYRSQGKPEYVTKLETELAELKAKTNEAYDFAHHESTTQAQTKTEKAWNDVWAKTREFQDKLGLKTSVDIKSINHYTDIVLNRAATDESGALKYSESDIAEAQAYINKLPKVDIDNYKKAVKLVNNFFDFNGDLPCVKYADLDEGAVLDGIVKKHGIAVNNIKKVDLTPAEKADALAKKQRENDEHVSGMPASQVGNGDAKLGDDLSQNEKAMKLKAMTETARANIGIISPKSPKYDKDFADKLNKLRFEVLGSAPK